jgi:hypothetical protein
MIEAIMQKYPSFIQKQKNNFNLLNNPSVRKRISYQNIKYV